MTDLMDWASARWAAFMWPSVWQATLVSLVALGVLIPIVRRVSPSLAMIVAALALMKFFMPAVVMSPIAILDRASGWVQPAVEVEWFPEAWLRGLMVVHVSGMCIGLSSLLVQRWRLARARQSGSCVIEGPLYQDLCEVGQRLGIRALPSLVLSDAVDAPVAIGVWSPAILLPTIAANRLTREHLRLVLGHELVHHKTHDLVGEVVLALSTVIWWFHPLVWGLAARVRELREERCDAAVVPALTDADSYCRALLAVASSQLAPPAIAMRTHGHPLARRFKRLVTASKPRRWQVAIAAVFVVGFALAAVPNTPRRGDRVRDNEQIRRDSAPEVIRIQHVRKVTRS